MKWSIIFAFASLLNAQVLDLPLRRAEMFGGKEFCNVVTSLPRAEREERIFSEILSGNIPDFLRTFVPISATHEIAGKPYTLTYFALPEYLAVGNDSDYFLCPMTPLLAQRIADSLHCMLPTKTMVDQIYAAAAVKLRPQPIPPDTNMTKMPRFIQHDDSVRAQRGKYPLGALVAGHKKDVIIHQKIYSELRPNRPKPVVIYGWHQLNGSPIQPPNNWHQETYVDYSHGVRLIRETAMINGAEISLKDILRDDTFHVFINDTTLTKPYYEITTTNR